MGIADHIKNGISRRGFVLGGAAAALPRCLPVARKKRAPATMPPASRRLSRTIRRLSRSLMSTKLLISILSRPASWTLPTGHAAVLLRWRLRRRDDGACFCPACQYAWCAQPGRWLAYHINRGSYRGHGICFLRCPCRRWRVCLGRDELCQLIVEALRSKSVGPLRSLATWLSSIEVARTMIRPCLRRSGHRSSGIKCLRQAAIKRVVIRFAIVARLMNPRPR